MLAALLKLVMARYGTLLKWWIRCGIK